MILQTWNGIVSSRPKNQPTTAVVRVVKTKKNEKYGKYQRIYKNLIVHDELDCPVGTEVIVQETPRKISKTKSKQIIKKVR